MPRTMTTTNHECMCLPNSQFIPVAVSQHHWWYPWRWENQKGVLGESLHWWEVPQLQTMTSWSCLTPLSGKIWRNRDGEGRGREQRGREGGTMH